MKFIKNIPFFLYILILYNILSFVGIDPATGQGMVASEVFRFNLISGAVVSLDVNSLVILVALHALYFEILKSTRSTVSSIVNHTLSMIVFIVFLVEFIVVKNMGTSAFLILMVMALFSVIAGFTVTISSARRDVTFER